MIECRCCWKSTKKRIDNVCFFFGSGYSALLIAVGISITASFIVCAIKSRMAETGILKGGLEMAGLGTGVALIGFGIGTELANLGIINV